VGKSSDVVLPTNTNLAVKRAQGTFFLTDDDDDDDVDVCGNVCVPYSSNTAAHSVTENICAIIKSLEKCYNNVTFTLKMVIASYTKMLQQLQHMT
jgi:hypothetical protein